MNFLSGKRTQREKDDPTPHRAPVYNAAPENAETQEDRPRFQRGSKLGRMPSHREWYDADTRTNDSEFGIHARQPGGQGEEGGSLALAMARTSSRRQGVTEKLANGLDDYEKNDAQVRKDQQDVLRNVQDGHSGESVLEVQGNNQRTMDIEKQQTDKSQSSSSSGPDDDDPDKNLVSWDTPDSLENPRNWSLHRRWAVIAIVSSYTFLSPLSSSMIAPALPIISQQFNITSSVEQSLMLSVFVLAYAIGPMFLGPCSEMFGRRIVLQLSNLFFIIFTVACAVAQNRIQLSIFRFFAGFGGSAPMSIGGGTVSDLMKPEERGTAMSVYSLAPLLGPAVGPIVGAFIIEYTGNWRWIFGVASIAEGVTAIVGLMLLPETYAPQLLHKKAERLRRETGNHKLHTIFEQNDVHWLTRFEHNMIRPFVLIGTQPIMQSLALFMMIIYGTMYILLTVFDSIFRKQYGESVSIASLNYISLAIGFTLAGQIGGRTIDFFYKRLRDQNDGVGRPEFKLPVMMSISWCIPAGLIVFGWTVEKKVHWIVPNIGSVIFAIGNYAVFQCIQNYLVDTYTVYAASALAANTFLRSLAGFALPLAAPTMFDRVGYGWGCSIIAIIAAVVGIPSPFLLYKYGHLLRAKSRYAITPVD